MKSVILLGQTNVGKTLFALNFAEYLGMEQLAITFKNRERGTYSRSFTLLEARSLLVSQKQHQTRDILSIVLSLPKGKGNKQFELLDTAGLNDGIHEDHRIRQAMAQTLRYIRQADIIFHMLDCQSIAATDILLSIGEIDYQIAQFGHIKQGYVILANKIDLPDSKLGFRQIVDEFPGNHIIAISALNKSGFKEVKRFARQLI